MANTLTNLLPDLYVAADVVSRELTGFIPSVFRNTSAERVAVNETVRYHIAPAGVSDTIAPAMAIPEPTDQTIGTGTITISKSKAAEFGFVGEEVLGLNNGPGHMSVQADMIAQALRVLVNEVEEDLSDAAIAGASRAYGAANALPFASTLADTAQLKKILDDNGAPPSDRQLVINTTTGASLRTLAQLTKANEAADNTMLRQGNLLDLHGFSISESAAPDNHTAGTGASATTTNAGFAVGTTSIALASAGTGTILAGDVITFAGDTRKYVVVTGDSDVSNGGTIVIQSPGLMQAIPAAATDITVVGTHSNNVAFQRSAIHLVARAPALPPGGDAAEDRRMIVDPRSGLAFEAAVYKGYRKMRFELALAWGVKVVAPRHTARLIGTP
jgi:hypothetical protein